MSNIPKIRFKVFTDAWEQRKFSEFVKNVAKKNKDNLDLEPYAVTNDRGFIAQKDAHDDFGYMKDTDRKAYNIVPPNSFAYNPARINVGSLGYYTGAESVIVSSLYEVFQTEEYIDDRFLWHWLKSDHFPKWIEKLQEGSVRLYFYFDKLIQCQMMMPSLKEQRQISTYLDSLDHLITLHQRKCDNMKKMKKFMLQKMFPKKGEKFPEIRFEGFTDAWEQRKFSELYEKNVEKNTELIGYDKTISIATMTYKDEGNGASDESLKTYKVLRTGDLAFEGHTNKDFRYGRFVANDIGTGIMSPRFSTLRPVKDMPVSFWKYYIHYEPIMRSVLVNSTKAGTMMNELVVADFMKQSIRVPSIGEQEKIGGYFSNLDHLITLHQRKSDELKEMKKYMLQNMFADGRK